MLHDQYDCSTELSRTEWYAVAIASPLVSNALVVLSIGMKGLLQIGTVKLEYWLISGISHRSFDSCESQIELNYCCYSNFNRLGQMVRMTYVNRRSVIECSLALRLLERKRVTGRLKEKA